MFEKSGKFYADWRAKDGKRTRKSFTSKRAALQYEAEQKELSHPKTGAWGRQSLKSYRPNSSPSVRPAATHTKSRKPSSLKLVHSRRKN